MDIFDKNKTYLKAYSKPPCMEESEVRQYKYGSREIRGRPHRRRRYHCFLCLEGHKCTSSLSGLNVFLLDSKGYRSALGNCFHTMIHKTQCYDPDFPSELERMRKKEPIKMKDQALDKKDPISVSNELADFKHVSDFSGIHKGAPVRRFRDFTSGLALSAIKPWLALSPNDTDENDGTITCNTAVVNYLLKRYATDAVIEKAEEEIRNIEQAF